MKTHLIIFSGLCLLAVIGLVIIYTAPPKIKRRTQQGHIRVVDSFPQPQIGDIKDGYKITKLEFLGRGNPFKQVLTTEDCIYNIYAYTAAELVNQEK